MCAASAKVDRIQIYVAPEVKAMFYTVHYELLAKHKLARRGGRWTLEDTLRYLLSLYAERKSAETLRSY